MKKLTKKHLLFGSATCFIVVFFLLLLIFCNSQKSVFTIGSRAISIEEVTYYLNQQKNATYVYFSSNYGADNFDESFWTTTFSDEKPLDYAKQRAIENCYTQNIRLMLAEQILGGSYTFETIENSYIQFNKNRSNALITNSIFFGPETLDFNEYCSYYSSNLKNEVIEKYRTDNRISDSSIELYYNSMKNTVFSTGSTLDFWVISSSNIDSSKELIAEARAEMIKNVIEPAILDTEPWNLQVDEYVLNEQSGAGIQATAATFLPLIDGLASGDTSDLTYDSNLGYFFIHVSSRKEGRVLELDEVHNRVETILLEIAYEEDCQKIREQNPVIINQKQLKKVNF